jgi:hypothetical protein
MSAATVSWKVEWLQVATAENRCAAAGVRSARTSVTAAKHRPTMRPAKTAPLRSGARDAMNSMTLNARSRMPAFRVVKRSNVEMSTFRHGIRAEHEQWDSSGRASPP